MEITVKEEIRNMSDAALKELFRDWLTRYDRVCRRALLALYDMQTENERRFPDSVHESDGKGFSPQDQMFLTNLAHQVLHGAELSERQYAALKATLPKYAGQLVKMTRFNQRKEDKERDVEFRSFTDEDLRNPELRDEVMRAGFIPLKPLKKRKDK